MNKEVLKQQETSSSALTQEDLQKIHQYTRRKLTEDELYVFSVILCDNDVDRDFEMFSVDALYSLKELFLGKTGIFDHNPKGNNQTARIFETEVMQIPEQETKTGEIYHCLKAKAYMVRNDKNKDLILEIDGGIKKEVSVGCSIQNKTCSICGTNSEHSPCEHIAGKYYNNQLCYLLLSNPRDAYEWSFVAIPAQRKAGVIKKYDHMGFQSDESSLREIEENISSIYCKITKSPLSTGDLHTLKAYIDNLKSLSNIGNAYINDLRADVLQLSYLVNEQIECEIMENLVQKMTLTELKAFKKAYEMKLNREDINVLQLGHCKNKAQTSNQEFKI